jgi:integrase
MTKLNEDVIKKLPVPAAGNKVHYFAGAVLQGKEVPAGFGVRITAAGARSFIFNYRNAQHAERRMTIGKYPDWSAIKAVGRARELRQAIDKGDDPLGDRRQQEAAAENTFKAIAEDYFKREGGKLRTGDRRRQAVKRLAYPAIGSKDIAEIKRSDIVKMLDKVEDENGPVMATRLLAYCGKIFNWHATRSDDFKTPIVRGMGRVNAKDRERKRVLADDELRVVWKAAMASGTPFGRLVQFILLTGCRRSEATGMARSELNGADWTLPAARNKVKQDLLRPLSKQALAVLPGGDGQFVFDDLTNVHWRVAAVQKASGTSNWTLHDLRRTARTLMSRARVDPDHAERCLGHVIGGIRANYDVHEYEDEKAEAYRALASLIERIVDPPADNVMPLKRRAI